MRYEPPIRRVGPKQEERPGLMRRIVTSRPLRVAGALIALLALPFQIRENRELPKDVVQPKTELRDTVKQTAREPFVVKIDTANNRVLMSDSTWRPMNKR